MDTTAASRGLATTAAAACAPLDAGCPVSAEYSAAYAGSGGQVWSTAQRVPGHPSEQTHAGAAFAPNLRCGQAGGMAPDQRWGGTSGAVTFPAATATMSAPSGLMYSDPWAAVAAPGVSAPSQAGGPPSWLLQGRGDPPPTAMATPSAAVPHQHPGAPSGSPTVYVGGGGPGGPSGGVPAAATGASARAGGAAGDVGAGGGWGSGSHCTGPPPVGHSHNQVPTTQTPMGGTAQGPPPTTCMPPRDRPGTARPVCLIQVGPGRTTSG